MIHPVVFKASSIPVATSCFVDVEKVELTFVPPAYVVAMKPSVEFALFDGALMRIVELLPELELSVMHTNVDPLSVTTEAVAPVKPDKFDTTFAAVCVAP